MKINFNTPPQTPRVKDIIMFTEDEDTNFICLVCQDGDDYTLVDMETAYVIVKEDSLENIISFANTHYTNVQIFDGDRATLTIN